MSRRTPLLAALAIVVAIVPAAPSLAADAHSPNMTHVMNVPYEHRNGATKSGGTDIEFARHRGSQYAFAGTYSNGMHIFDITNPRRTDLVGVYDCGITQGDVQIFRQSDERGRIYATYTSDTVNDGTSPCNKQAQRLGFNTLKSDGTGKNGTFIVDVTNPRRPKTVSFVEVVQGSHNMTVHPSGNYMYNSNSDLITSIAPAIEIVDISNPERPKLLKNELPLTPLPGLGTESHDITFSDDGKRAYSAALSHGVIIDTSKPAAPKIISEWDDETINVWHQADPVTIGGRDFVIAEDEMYGAAGGPHCPSGGVHIYDVTGELEKAPVKVGYWNIDEIRATSSATGRCTAHVFDIHEDEQIMTIAFYNGGVHVVDLSGLADASETSLGLGNTVNTPGALKEIGFYRFDGMDSWSAKTPFIEADGDFYLYGNDQRRGLDVYRFDAEKQKSAKKGKYMTAREASVALAPRKASSGQLAQYGMYCLLGK